MTDVRRAYSSTVVAPGHLAACVVLAAALLSCGIAFLPAGAAAATAAVAALIVFVGVQMATVRLMVDPGYVRVSQGPWGLPGRVIPAGLVRDARAEQLSFLQTFGIGMPFRWKTTRLTVRPGATLELVLSDGECIRISTRDPVVAALLISGRGHAETGAAGRATKTETREEGNTMLGNDRHPGAGKRPWFGPKRIGWGYRPQTWQGWAITLVPALLVILIVLLVR